MAAADSSKTFLVDMEECTYIEILATNKPEMVEDDFQELIKFLNKLEVGERKIYDHITIERLS